MVKTYKMMTLSTAHIKKETADMLDNEEVDIVSYDKDGYGWFIYVVNWNDNPYAEIPEDLKDCLKFAEENGCDWLMFDGAADVANELPQYNW